MYDLCTKVRKDQTIVPVHDTSVDYKIIYTTI